MKKLNNKIKAVCLLVLSGLFLFTACNKSLEEFAPLPKPTYPSGNGIAATIAANPNDSLYSRLIVRSGLGATLNDSTKLFTLFVTDNAGMKIFVNAASGGLVPLNAPDAVFSNFIANSLPVASAQGIVSYNTVGQKFPSSSFPTTFPNFPLPTQIILDPTQPFVRMPIFPAKGSPYSYVNNIPLTSVDQVANNGVIHHTYTIVAPPTATLKTMIAAEPTLSYFRAAIARADSGAVGLGKLDSLLGYGVTNMTVLTPNDVAMKATLYGAIYQALYPTVYTGVYNAAYASAISGGATAAQAAAIATTQATAQAPGITNAQAASLSSTPGGFNLLPVATVKGIMAYHFLASLTTSTATPYQPNIRVFSVNVPAIPTFVKTLVNGGVAAHPGILAKATFTGPAATGVTFTGLGPLLTPTTVPYSGTPANVVAADKHAVNGVYHIIDAVLFPQ